MQGAQLEGARLDHPLQADGDGAAPTAPSATVFVKNLAFATGDEALRRHFDESVTAAGGVIRSAVVHKSKSAGSGKGSGAKGAGQKLLSSGFGFVECSTEDVAKDVVKRMQVGCCSGLVRAEGRLA